VNEPNSTPRGAALPRPPLITFFALQLVILLIGSLLLRGLLGWQELNSASIALNGLIGGSISWIANAYFARMAFRHRGARQMAQVARGFYLGESGKFILASSLFVIAFVTLKPLHPIALFGGYAVMTAVNGFFALRLVKALG
jgi:ATP synthase protein I